MSRKFCVSITQCVSDADKATVGFVVANAALGSEKDTMVFLSADGVWAAVGAKYGSISAGEPFAPLKDLVDKYVAGGGKILACAPCLKKRGLAEGDLIAGATPAGGAALVDFLSDGTPCISY
ncbi:MAG: DsrE family protein [bacterium]